MVKSKGNTSRPTTNNDLSIKQRVEETVADGKKSYNLEISLLKAELTEVRNSQEFICQKYEELKLDFDKLDKINKQEANISALKPQLSDLKKQSNKENDKIDFLEQYGRGQNIEFVSVPITNEENTNDIVVEVANLVGVKVLPEHISTSYRMPIKAKNKNGRKNSTPPLIIVRFTSRDNCNKIYASCRLIRLLDLTKFSVPNTSHILPTKT